MVKDRTGFVRIFYMVLLFLFGIGLWAYVQSIRPRELSQEQLNAKLVRVLSDGGVDQSRYVSQTSVDRKLGQKAWKEYEKVFYVPKEGREKNIDKYIYDLDKFSVKNGLTLSRPVAREDKVEVKIQKDDQTYFSLVLIPIETAKLKPQKKPVSAKPVEVVAAKPAPPKTADKRVQQQPLPPPARVKAPPPAPAPVVPQRQKNLEQPAAPKTVPAETKRSHANEKTAVLIIVDVGAADNLDSFLELGVPITFAILPEMPYTSSSAEKLSKKKYPYLADIPMEPMNYPDIDPGKGSLFVDMTPTQIKEKFDKDMEGLRGCVGVTNHMGSKFMANLEKMRILLKLVSDKSLMYFDTMTTLDSKASRAAKDLKVTYRENQVFLDLKDDPGFIRSQFEIFLRTAKQNGQCIAIGHINKRHLLGVLREFIPKFEEEKINFVFLSDI
jgi:uncharacterized protein